MIQYRVSVVLWFYHLLYCKDDRTHRSSCQIWEVFMPTTDTTTELTQIEVACNGLIVHMRNLRRALRDYAAAEYDPKCTSLRLHLRAEEVGFTTAAIAHAHRQFVASLGAEEPGVAQIAHVLLDAVHDGTWPQIWARRTEAKERRRRQHHRR